MRALRWLLVPERMMCTSRRRAAAGYAAAAWQRDTRALCAAQPDVCAVAGPRLPSRSGRTGRPAGLSASVARARAAPPASAYETPVYVVSLGEHRNSHEPLVLLVCQSRDYRSQQVHGPAYGSVHALEHLPGGRT